MNPQRIQQLVRRWRWRLGMRDGLFALGAAGVTAAAGVTWTTGWASLAAAAFVATLAAKLMFSRPWTLDPARVVRHLDRTYPDLEESSVLFLRDPASLTLLERLQLKRIDTAISWVIPADPPPGAPPRGFLRTATWCGLAGAGLWAAAGVWTLTHGSRGAGRTEAKPHGGAVTAAAPPAAPAWPRISGGGLTVTPPAYTGRPARRVADFNAEVEAGATVAWAFALDRPVREARLVFSDGANGLPLRVEHDGASLAGEQRVTEAGLYGLAAVLPDGAAWNPPELWSLKVIPDRAPTLRVLQPAEARTVVEPSASPPLPVTVEVLAGDDYGVAEAHLVATVAKGSGEAVKFREQTFPFDTDAAAETDAPHGRRLTRALDLGALGMEAGDELYFFVEARDNRPGAPNRTRSETRFIVWRGPAQKATTSGRGMAGINLVPQYFRSERQIIIDTEKLLADRPAIPDHDFRQRANDLGVDQQLLRLRYGQFLGEELENSAVADHLEMNLHPLRAAPPENTGPHAAAGVALRFRQEHAEQDRGDGGDGNAGPRAAPEKPLGAGEVRRPFVDSHDTQDAATLFDRDTKGTMKDALAAMWEAEGCLRTARPADALAPAHRALDILKDIQQAARAYVQHVGFEPTPLNIHERRLKGDATGAPARAVSRDPLPPADPVLADVRAALAVIPWDNPPPPAAAWPPGALAALASIEPPLTAAATRQPEAFLDGLQTLRRLRAGGTATITADALRPLQRALWRLLPRASALPGRTPESAPSLKDAYDKALQGTEAMPP